MCCVVQQSPASTRVEPCQNVHMTDKWQLHVSHVNMLTCAHEGTGQTAVTMAGRQQLHTWIVVQSSLCLQWMGHVYMTQVLVHGMGALRYSLFGGRNRVNTGMQQDAYPQYSAPPCGGSWWGGCLNRTQSNSPPHHESPHGGTRAARVLLITSEVLRVVVTALKVLVVCCGTALLSFSCTGPTDAADIVAPRTSLMSLVAARC